MGNRAAALPMMLTEDPATVFGAKVPLEERMGRGQ